MIPSLGVNNIKSTYRTGGGEAGNFEAFSITKLYSALKYIDKVYNPVASEGGYETENLEELIERAPATFKHRNRIVSRDDVTYFSKKASKKVAKVKVLSGSDEEGNIIPGLITVVIVPDLSDARPAPTEEIMQIIEAYLLKRAPNVGKLKVIGPLYFQVNVKASLVTTDIEAVSELENRIRTKIEEFLHPLKGGKEGNGWDFGQVPSTSNFYSLLSDLNGVSYIEEIDVTLKAENGSLEKPSKFSESYNIPNSALPCNGMHEINVFWQTEREE
jgi:predicted phage baseplate assembly protein